MSRTDDALAARIDQHLSADDIHLDDPVTALTGVTETAVDRYAAFGADDRTIRALFRNPIGLGTEVPTEYREEAVLDLLSVPVEPADVGVDTEAELAMLRFVTAFKPHWTGEEFETYPQRGPETLTDAPYRIGGFQQGKGLWWPDREDAVEGPTAVLDAERHSVGYLSEPVKVDGTPYSLLTSASDPARLAGDDVPPHTRITGFDLLVLSSLLDVNFARPDVYESALSFATEPVMHEDGRYPYGVLFDADAAPLRGAVRHITGQGSNLREQVVDGLNTP